MVETKNLWIGILVVAFMTILVGTIGSQIIAENVIGITQKEVKTETLNLAPAIVNGTYINDTSISLSSSTLYDSFRTDYTECEVTALLTVANGTGTAKTTPATYNFTKASGTTPAYIKISRALAVDTDKNWISSSSNTSTITYSHCQDNYIGGWQKNILNLVPGFFALGVFAAGAFVIFLILKKSDIDIGL